MTENVPPQWLERILFHLLPARDRETISGDLLEEYREQHPRSGAFRTNLWYLRQVLSLMPFWDLAEASLNRLLLGTTVFVVIAGVWLAAMENVLKHAGYSQRTLFAATIVMQAVATLLRPLLSRLLVFRVLLVTGATALAFFGAAAIQRILVAPHFEGFVLLIGFALAVQGLLTLAVVLRPRRAAIL